MCAGERSITLDVAADAPRRLDTFLLAELSSNADLQGYSRSQIKIWIERGAVRVGARVVLKAGTALRPGETVTLMFPEAEPSNLVPFECALPILYEDEAIVVIDKPSGLTMHPGAGNKFRTVVNALIAKFAALPEADRALRPGVVHRLDKDTSGVVVLAKTVTAHAQLVRQFSAHTVERAYYALAFCGPRAHHPIARADCGTISENIGRHARERTKFSVVGEGGKRAVTHWKVVKRMPFAALLEVRLETGRTHQIRVHLTHLGAPLIGDRSYGTPAGLPRELEMAAQTLHRQALHAFLLAFNHPLTGARARFESSLPEDFRAAMETFQNYQ